ncbi:MAG: hypothetical protein O7C75_07490 [Verrucomicrobia bacterium]|nr:hypothetical protein [Verrucomicrobiota bacterium]
MKPSILHFDDTSNFWHRMDRNYRHKYERIVAQLNVAAYDLKHPREEVLSPAYDLLLVGSFGHSGYKFIPDNAIKPEHLDHIPCRCVILEDMHKHTFKGGVELFCEHLDKHYNYVLVTYDCEELDFIQSRCPNIRRFFVLPHFVDTMTFCDYGLDKVWDILLYGNVRVERYPFRSRLQKLLRESDLSLKIVEHPGYENYDTEVCGKGLARMINQAHITIATPAYSDYLVAKYYEISGAKSMIAGKMATQGEAIWQDHYIRLGEDMSDTEILDRLKETLADKDHLEASTNHMYEIVRTQHSMDKFQEALETIVLEMMADFSSFALN